LRVLKVNKIKGVEQMNKQEFINEVTSKYDNTVTVITNDGEYDIMDGSNFVGGVAGTYMCELLGNVYYQELSTIAGKLYDYITKELAEQIEQVEN
jgi:hypothetical protein